MQPQNTQYNSDMITNMIIATSLSSCISMLSSNIPNIINFIMLIIKKISFYIYLYIFQQNLSKINIVGSVKNKNEDVQISFPIEYYAIIEKIMALKDNINNIKYTNNENKCIIYSNNNTQANDVTREFYIDGYFKTYVEKDICIEICEPVNNQQNIIISSKKYNRDDLQKIISIWTNGYVHKYNKITILNNIVTSGGIAKIKSSNEYCAIIYKILSKKINLKFIEYTNCESNESNENICDDDDMINIKNVMKFYINKYTKIYFENDIIIEFSDLINPAPRNIENNDGIGKNKNAKKDLNLSSSLISQNVIISSQKHSIEKLRNIISGWVDDYVSMKESISMIIISASVGKNWYEGANFPIEYKTIMSKFKKKEQNLYNISYINDKVDIWTRESAKNDANKYQYYINCNKKFLIEDNIYVEFANQHKQDCNTEQITYQIIISSNIYTTPQLQETISGWVNTFKKELRTYTNDGTLYYYSLDKVNNNILAKLSNNTKDNDDDKKKYNDPDLAEMLWSKNILISFKTFDNIFFDYKNILLKKMNHFLNNESWYKKKGIPYNIGLLFHGTPGCGKTSCIKAISNYTKRHVVEINLKKIKTCGEFMKIFNLDNMNSDYIPHNNKIIVLEDIDCMIDIVKSREKEKEKEENEKNNIKEEDSDVIKIMKLNEKREKSEEEMIKKMYKNDDSLTLSCILNTIDGVLENYGRILIITTNRVEELDSALIRPGRIDMKINFTKCSKQMYFDIIEHYYEITIPKDTQFIDFKHSPAEILEICSLYNDNIGETLRILVDSKYDNNFDVMT